MTFDRHSIPIRPPACFLPAVGLAFCLAACHAGPRNFENENDRLRKENLQLAEQVEQLTLRVAALESALHQAEQQLAERQHTPALPPGLHRPLCARLALDRFSGGVDTDGDGRDDRLRLYLLTLDTRGRFIPTIARLELTVAHLPAGKPARTLARTTIDARSFDAAYRSGLTGTHYTLELPLQTDLPPDTSCLSVSIALTDLVHGHTLTLQQPVPWSTGRPSPPDGQAPDPPPSDP